MSNPLIVTGPLATDVEGVYIRAEFEPKKNKKGQQLNTTDPAFAKELMADAFCDEQGNPLPEYEGKLGTAQARYIITSYMAALDKVGKSALEGRGPN